MRSHVTTPASWTQAALRALKWSAWRRKDTCSSLPEHVLPELRQRKIDSLYYLQASTDDPMQRAYDAVWRVQRAGAIQVIEHLAASGVDAVVLKGAEVFPCWFEDRAIGMLNDVDLLIDPGSVPTAKSVLCQLGYCQGVFDEKVGGLVPTDFREVGAREAGAYELDEFCRLDAACLADDEQRAMAGAAWRSLKVVDSSSAILTSIDVHHRIFSECSNGALIERSTPSALGVGRALSHTDALWLLSAKFYNEVTLQGKSSLRDLAYMAPMLASGSIDWRQFLSTVEEYDLFAEVYYVVAFLSSLLDDVVDSEVLNALSPNGKSRQRDWGWQLGKLFGFVEPLPRSLGELIDSVIGSES